MQKKLCQAILSDFLFSNFFYSSPSEIAILFVRYFNEWKTDLLTGCVVSAIFDMLRELNHADLFLKM